MFVLGYPIRLFREQGLIPAIWIIFIIRLMLHSLIGSFKFNKIHRNSNSDETPNQTYQTGRMLGSALFMEPESRKKPFRIRDWNCFNFNGFYKNDIF